MLNIITAEHERLFWAQSTKAPIRAYQLSAKTLLTASDAPPCVYAAISVQSSRLHPNRLHLSYLIQSRSWIHIPPLQTTTPIRADELWLDNCLECFFSLDDSTSYTELNVSPDGRFNLYRFDSYRHPTPPKTYAGDVFLSPAPDDHFTTSAPKNYWIRHISIELDAVSQLTLQRFNLCVILYHADNGTPIYYAISHADPADFHDQTYWQAWI